MSEENEKIRVNPGYVLGQLSKAFKSRETHEDVAVRERAETKVDSWIRIFEGILTGALKVGSRTPVSGAPIWATLEVSKGGFATGRLLAGGSVMDHERDMLSGVPRDSSVTPRAALNSYFLTDQGINDLQEMLASGCYRVNVPEEAALLVVAWLLGQGDVDGARLVMDEIGPHLSDLRFYPVPDPQPLAERAFVELQDVGETRKNFEAIRPRIQLDKQREAIQIWMPLYDRAVALFAETVSGDWPCQHYPEGWTDRAKQLMNEYAAASMKHRLCSKPRQKKENFSILRQTLLKCIENPKKLSGRDVGRVRSILKSIEAKRGLPTSSKCRSLRASQLEKVARPTQFELAQVMIARLSALLQSQALERAEEVLYPIREQEAEKFGVPVAHRFPEPLRRKVMRCVSAPLETLVSSKLITSAESLAKVIPQISSEVHASTIIDPDLRRLFAALYKAFRRRRSLLLLDLSSQAKLTELPWVKVLQQYRSEADSREWAVQCLRQIVVVTLHGFPQQVFPNKLLQEFRALLDIAGLQVPIVDELAADIFVGKFSATFVEATQRSSAFMKDTLYGTYYDLAVEPSSPDELVKVCAQRAGVSLSGDWSVARNGMILEQEQILTTHNLAALFEVLDLKSVLEPEDLQGLAERCFTWICKRQQLDFGGDWHSKLIMLKNTAYAWRQMIFFLSMLPPEMVQKFLEWSQLHLSKQRQDFQTRFEPAMNGLRSSTHGQRLYEDSTAKRFLGWTIQKHWLL